MAGQPVLSKPTWRDSAGETKVECDQGGSQHPTLAFLDTSTTILNK